MSYQVLARKWRPQKFADMVGQEHVVRTLQNALRNHRVGHAYLFVGPRGTGKTTTARIFAKALNCEVGDEVAEPCCQCESCRQIAAGNSLDVVEIDGASHNKVEDVRELRENVQYTPTSDRYKIYIIDEVHMLSNAAWNALLKTLEEPPPHVKFFFATTEPHKVLPTILSRCQRFDLKRLSAGLIAQRLAWIANRECVKIDERALAAIARAADGGMRDGQSIFDQVISFGQYEDSRPIGEEDVISVFGLASSRELHTLARALINDSPAELVRLVQELADRGRDLERTYADLLVFMRDLLIVLVCPEPRELLEVGDAEAGDLLELAAATDQGTVRRILERLIDCEAWLRNALNKRVYLEVIMIKVMRHAHSLPVEAVIERLNQLRRHGLPTPQKTGGEDRPQSGGQAPASQSDRTSAAKPSAAMPAPASPRHEPPVAEPQKDAAPPMGKTADTPPPESPASGPARNVSPKAQASPAPPADQPPAGRIQTTPFDQPPPPALPEKPDDATYSASAEQAGKDEMREQPEPAVEPPAAEPPPGEAREARHNDDCAAVWHRLIEQAGEDPHRRGLRNHMQEMRPVSYLGDALIVAYDEEFPREHAATLCRPETIRYLEGLLRRDQGRENPRIVIKKWSEELSDDRKRHLVSTPEVRQRVENDPFVKRVLDLFGGEIVDVRG